MFTQKHCNITIMEKTAEYKEAKELFTQVIRATSSQGEIGLLPGRGIMLPIVTYCLSYLDSNFAQNVALDDCDLDDFYVILFFVGDANALIGTLFMDKAREDVSRELWNFFAKTFDNIYQCVDFVKTKSTISLLSVIMTRWQKILDHNHKTFADITNIDDLKKLSCDGVDLGNIGDCFKFYAEKLNMVQHDSVSATNFMDITINYVKLLLQIPLEAIIKCGFLQVTYELAAISYCYMLMLMSIHYKVITKDELLLNFALVKKICESHITKD